MKILNLYAGVGGNRRLWGDKHEITAVEWNKSVADCYKDLYPNDTVILARVKLTLMIYLRRRMKNDKSRADL